MIMQAVAKALLIFRNCTFPKILYLQSEVNIVLNTYQKANC